jgi:hypothetical protein
MEFSGVTACRDERLAFSKMECAALRVDDRVGLQRHPFVTAQEAMVDGGEGTAKYAKGAKGEANLQSIIFVYFAYFVVKRDFRQHLRERRHS